MRKKFQILSVISLMAVLQLGFWSFTFLSYKYLKNELIDQVVLDNHVIVEQMVTLLQKTGLTDENSETDSLLQNICDKIKLPNGGFICAINRSGNLVAAPGLMSGMSMPFKPVLRNLDEINQKIYPLDLGKDVKFSGYAYFKDENRLDIVTSLPIGDDLRMFVHQNSELIKQKAWESVKPLILFGFLVTFFMGVFAWMTIKKIIEPFESKIETQSTELKDALRLVSEKQSKIIENNKVLDYQSNVLLKSQHLIAEKDNEIINTINFANKALKALQPNTPIENTIIDEHFILFLPKGAVGGDFYWYHNFDNLFVITVADCTGHGIRGAIMSMMGISFLNEIIIEKQIKDPGIILEYLRRNIIVALGQESGKNASTDGMNMALCVIDKTTDMLDFAGAYNPVIIIRGNEMFKLEGDRMPIGIHAKMDDEFSNKSLRLQSGNIIYLFSDGYANQFGGEKGRKFMSKNFNSLLYEIKDLRMPEQKNILEQTFVEWKGAFNQVDDVLIIGLKIR